MKYPKVPFALKNFELCTSNSPFCFRTPWWHNLWILLSTPSELQLAISSGFLFPFLFGWLVCGGKDGFTECSGRDVFTGVRLPRPWWRIPRQQMVSNWRKGKPKLRRKGVYGRRWRKWRGESVKVAEWKLHDVVDEWEFSDSESWVMISDGKGDFSGIEEGKREKKPEGDEGVCGCK